MERQIHRAVPDKLQFLDRTDFQRYTLALVDQSGHLTNNPDYLPVFHHQYLTKHRSESKKDSGCVDNYYLPDILSKMFLALNTE